MKYLFCAFVILCATRSFATEYQWTVAVSNMPPYVFYDAELPESDRQPSGFIVDLWQEVADALEVHTTWRYHDQVTDVFSSVFDGSADLGLIAFPTGALELGYEVVVIESQSLFSLAKRAITEFINRFDWKSLVLPAGVLFIAANIRLFLENLKPVTQRRFPDNYVRGLAESTWWTLCLLIDWGKGDEEHPATRAYDLLWHLAGLVILSSLIGVMTASLTMESINQRIEAVEALDSQAVAALNLREDTVRAALGRHQPGEVFLVENFGAAIDLLASGKVAAVIGPSRIIRMNTQKLADRPVDGLKVRILGERLGEQNYALVVSPTHRDFSRVDELVRASTQPNGLQPSLVNMLRAKWNQGQ